MTSSAAKEPELPLSAKDLSQDEILLLFADYKLKQSPHYDAKDIDTLLFVYKESKVHILSKENLGGWKRVEKTPTFPHKGQDCSVVSVIEPLVNEAGEGVCSADRITQMEKAPNMAHTELHNQKGDVLFRGTRHGILDPYKLSGKNLKRLPDDQIRSMLEQAKDDSPKIALKVSGLDDAGYDSLIKSIKKNKKEANSIAKALRKVASHNMAKNMLDAAINAEPEIVEKGLRGETPTVALNSVCLVSPAAFLSTLKPDKSERNMLDIQNEAFGFVQGRQSITVVDPSDGQHKKINVNVKINKLNFGVNEVTSGALAKLSLSLIHI